MSNEKVLIFRKGEEYKIKVESIDEFNTSLFRDIYNRAAIAVNEIVANSEDQRIKKSNKEIDDFDLDAQKFNNIIAFTGDRGTGKTSAMVSFAKALKRCNKLKNDESVKIVDIELKYLSFHDIGIVDPSLFTANNNIVEIIIARMFEKFKTEINNKNREFEFEKQKKLLDLFSKVHENLKTIEQPKDKNLDGETLEVLSRLACSTNLKSSIEHLIEEYLNFMNNSKTDNFLLLVIDDIDLNTKHAHELVEQIRKYLILNNVIILFAVKIDQLQAIVEQEFRKEFQMMLHKDYQRISQNEPKLVSIKYLEKLIPEKRRLVMTSIKALDSFSLRVIENHNVILEKEIQDGIISLIKMKLGLLFVKPIGSFHFIVPGNLRTLVSLLTLLTDFTVINFDYYYDEKVMNTESSNANREINSLNLDKFEDFFINIWCSSNLSDNNFNKFMHIVKATTVLKNKATVRSLYDIFPDTGSYNNEINDILDIHNEPRNISLGDVLYILNEVSFYNQNEELSLYTFAIKVFYSIMIYRFTYLENNRDSLRLIMNGSIYNEHAVNLLNCLNGSYKFNRFNFNYKSFHEKQKEASNSNYFKYFFHFVTERDNKYRRSNKFFYKDQTAKILNEDNRNTKFDLFAFIYLSIDQKENEASLSSSMELWQNRYRIALPLFSLDTLEKILNIDSSFSINKNVQKVNKSKSENREHLYISNIIREYFDKIANCLEGVFKESFIKNPVVEAIMSKQLDNFFSDVYLESKKITREIITEMDKYSEPDSFVNKSFNTIKTEIETLIQDLMGLDSSGEFVKPEFYNSLSNILMFYDDKRKDEGRYDISDIDKQSIAEDLSEVISQGLNSFHKKNR
ncbi:MAG: hypothetical protein JXR48_11860 [Candidatus Delongbacteria bacterium]|nr:hypothetical protein [Candidatus Delongbacteria bacterium]MBN2835647.1 hypothetical protein [Candidatus Delongbacteria bacterium]